MLEPSALRAADVDGPRCRALYHDSVAHRPTGTVEKLVENAVEAAAGPRQHWAGSRCLFDGHSLGGTSEAASIRRENATCVGHHRSATHCLGLDPAQDKTGLANHHHQMFRNILLATDGSTASAHAVQLAVDLARAHGATLMAVYVVDPYPYIGIGDTNPMGMNAYLATAREHAAQAHANVAQRCNEATPPVPLEVRLVEHLSAVNGVLETARLEHADLIVAGSRGRAGWESALHGSVATKLVHHAQVPVLIVP